MDGEDGLFRRNGLQGVLKGKESRALDRALSFVAEFIDRRTKHDRTAPLTKVQARHSGIVCDVIKEEGQQVWTQKPSKMLYERVNSFERRSVSLFDEHCESCLYTIKYHLLGRYVLTLKEVDIERVYQRTGDWTRVL